MLKIKEVPNRFPGVTEHMIRQLVVTGAIPHVMVGKKYLICEDVLSDFLIKGNNQMNQIDQIQGKIRKVN
jgi:hypothetical protein